jgi:hypothetical protein
MALGSFALGSYTRGRINKIGRQVDVVKLGAVDQRCHDRLILPTDGRPGE